MRLEALDHPKTMDFATRLNVELPTAIGYLELLWAFAGKKTPRGDIGKWSDAVIATACHWRGAPSDFVQALVTARFVDPHPEYRLVVHDWHEHCPNWVRAKLRKDGVEFAMVATNTPSNANSNDTPSGDPSDPSSRADLNQGKRSEAKGSGAGALVLHESLPEDAWGEWIEHRKAKRFPTDDRTLRRQLALLAKYPTGVQREIIDTSINAGWQGLFEPKGAPRGTLPPGRPSALADDWPRLRARAERIGFREPREGESAGAYHTLLTRAEAERNEAAKGGGPSRAVPQVTRQ